MKTSNSAQTPKNDLKRAAPSRDGARYSVEGSDENSRQLGLEQTGENSIELMLKKLDESLEELKQELNQLEQGGEDSMVLTPEEKLELESELEKLEQKEINSMELTPEEESDLEIKLMEQQLKKEDKEAKKQLENPQTKDEVNLNIPITSPRKHNDLLDDMPAKEVEAAEEKLGKKEPEIDNRNRISFFTRIGNMTSISSFCRSLLPNRDRGPAAEGELVEKKTPKQDFNEEKMELVEMRELLNRTKKDVREALEDAREALIERAAENKKSKERIEILKAKQALVTIESKPSNTSASASARAASNSPNSRQNPKV
jgi:hypothetical protein